MTLSSGFSLVAGNLPNSIQVNRSADFTIQLDATTEGSYSSTLNILNNDPDEDSFNVVIAGTVTSNQDLNTGSLIGNLTLGSHNLYAGNAKINVFVGVEDSFDFFEPLTLDDWPWVIEQGSLVDINAIITPEPNHEPVDIVVVAALDVGRPLSINLTSNLTGFIQEKRLIPLMFLRVNYRLKFRVLAR
ncbi:MAG: hypothetical protein B6247_30120 [Candidatus Parabeggiatoa sp. nov. 2]|nr:MAG: hypothetical protein B6247_30120 [Beggiatoa sp. 4572_84]